MSLGRGLNVFAILGSRGVQSECTLGALSVLLSVGLRIWMAACSVRSSCPQFFVVVRIVVLFYPIVCPVVRACRAGADLMFPVLSSVAFFSL